MPRFNDDLFWNEYQHFSDLSKLEAVLEQLDFSDLIRQIRRWRGDSGRADWPIEGMLNAVVAVKVLQHRSISSFRRELKRNPSLMRALGLPMRQPKPCDRTVLDFPDCERNYPVPSDSAFSRFRARLLKLEDSCGGMTALFDRQVEKLGEALPDLGQDIGYDGKAIRSHSTGNPVPGTGTTPDGKDRTSDPDARWGKHSHFVQGANGKEEKITKCWFGYKLHLVADVRHELPLGFELTPASDSEHGPCRELLQQHLDSPLGSRTGTFVADRGLDNDTLRATAYRAGVLPVIQSRQLWQDKNIHPEQLNVPTRPLNEQTVDTVLVTEHGDLHCRCPETDTIRPMTYQGCEKKRGTTKWVCPADANGVTCEGRAQCFRSGGVKAGAKTRTVRLNIDPDHLRSRPALPPGTLKWKRLYNRRSALERINSRIDNAFLTHDHFQRGLKRIRLEVCLGLTVMLAVANHAIEAGRPEQMRSAVRLLAA